MILSYNYYKFKDPHAFLGAGKRKNEKKIVEEKDETAGRQSYKKTIDWSFKSTQTFTSKNRSMQPIPQSNIDRTKVRENCTVLHIGLSKYRS